MRSYIHKHCYLALLGVVIFDCAAIAFTNARIDPMQFTDQLILVAVLWCFVVIVSKTRFTDSLIQKICVRASYVFQGLAFLLVGWIAIRLANHLSMKLTADIGYVDGLLAQMDHTLSASWVSYFEALQAFPNLLVLLDQSYTSLTLFSVVAYAIISFSPDARRSAYFLETFFYTAVICTFFGMFFPAQGTVFFLLGPEYDFSSFPAHPGMWFIDPLAELRSGAPVELNLRNLPGLVTFPSFHTAACIILIVSFWRTMLFVPALLYSCTVIAATPIFGGHYLVDLLGGTAVAILVAAILARRRRFIGLFAAKNDLVPDCPIAGEAI